MASPAKSRRGLDFFTRQPSPAQRRMDGPAPLERRGEGDDLDDWERASGPALVALHDLGQVAAASIRLDPTEGDVGMEPGIIGPIARSANRPDDRLAQVVKRF